MAEKKEREKDVAEIVKKLTALREELGVIVPKLRKERDDVQVRISKRTEEYQKSVAEDKRRLTEIDGILQMAGVKVVKERAPAGRVAGGWKKIAAEWINEQGVGTEFRYTDFRSGTGMTSGYAGVILKEYTDAGFLSKPTAGNYRVEGVIPIEG